jgi:pimeloyl-ACP methyl ester carboxylesterase
MPVLSIGDTAMTYTEAGSGRPLLLIHGSLCDYRYWAPQMAAFAAICHVIAPSLRHYWPQSWDGGGEDFTTDRHARDVVAFIAELGLGPVDLCGHSRGGYIAFRVAQHHPERVRKLILAEPGGSVGTESRRAGPTPVAAAMPEVTALIQRGETDAGLRLFIEAIDGPRGWDRTSSAFKQMARANARTLLGQIQERRPPITLGDIAKIRAPTLLVGGERTPPPFPDMLNALESALANVQRVTVPKARHAMNVENPAAFNAAVLAFLAA